MLEFSRNWTAEVLQAAPLIAPARHFVWPTRIAGEEDALARGALLLNVRPQSGGAYLLTCALGFRDPSMPTGVYGCPNADQICAIAGGYGYIADARHPDQCTQVALKPIVEVHPAVEAGLLLFVGFHTIVAWGSDGLAWQTGRLSWEGVRGTSLGATEVRGLGWDLRGDVEVEFIVSLADGSHQGGGYRV